MAWLAAGSVSYVLTICAIKHTQVTGTHLSWWALDAVDVVVVEMCFRWLAFACSFGTIHQIGVWATASAQCARVACFTRWVTILARKVVNVLIKIATDLT